LRKEIRLEEVATPEQVVSGFWESDLIVLIRVIRFFLEHFHPDQVIKAAIGHGAVGQKALPWPALKQYARLLSNKEGSERKDLVLGRAFDSSGVSSRDLDPLCADHLRKLTRFDIVRLTSHARSAMRWLDDLRREARRLSQGFEELRGEAPLCKNFRRRISAVSREKSRTTVWS
jgi:hypothetical protein